MKCALHPAPAAPTCSAVRVGGSQASSPRQGATLGARHERFAAAASRPSAALLRALLPLRGRAPAALLGRPGVIKLRAARGTHPTGRARAHRARRGPTLLKGAIFGAYPITVAIVSLWVPKISAKCAPAACLRSRVTGGAAGLASRLA